MSLYDHQTSANMAFNTVADRVLENLHDICSWYLALQFFNL